MKLAFKLLNLMNINRIIVLGSCIGIKMLCNHILSESTFLM